MGESAHSALHNPPKDVKLIGFPDSGYPDLLRNIPDPPPYFWYKGNENGFKLPCVSIVGTRRASDYGKRVAHRIAFELASAGLCIVSGLAYGIDKAAHEGALDAGGTTIAVLGSGVEEVYPRQHQSIARQITQRGCLISEYEPDVRPDKTHFPERNRIISGLSHATIVVEAFQKAGALITAHLCIEQKRDLYAVPGRIDEGTSVGTNALLEASAAAVFRSSEQLLEEYSRRGWFQQDHEKTPELSPTPESKKPRTRLENDVLACLSDRSLHIDEIETTLDFPGGALWSALLHLECDGLIRAVEGNYYERSRW